MFRVSRLALPPLTLTLRILWFGQKKSLKVKVYRSISSSASAPPSSCGVTQSTVVGIVFLSTVQQDSHRHSLVLVC